MQTVSMTSSKLVDGTEEFHAKGTIIGLLCTAGHMRLTEPIIVQRIDIGRFNKLQEEGDNESRGGHKGGHP